ncbi:MAG: hypothetical protein QM696_07655 [Steroidobacteraceae bacterium]
MWAGASRNPPPGAPPPELLYDQLEVDILKHLQPWALAKHDTTEWNIDDTGQVCKPVGMFRQGHEGSGGFRFVEAPGKLYQMWFSVEMFNLRRIYLDSPHPKDVPITLNGDARGHWEGDTFVVDIVGFSDRSWLGSDRHPHTEELHVVERYRLFGDGAYMELRVFVWDRKAFTTPYTYTRYYKKMPEETVAKENVCNILPPGENLWRVRRDALLAEQAAIFSQFMDEYKDRPVPVVNEPAAGTGASAPANPPASAATLLPQARALVGVYAVLPPETATAGGRRGSGPLVRLPLRPAAAATARERDMTLDPVAHCQAIGPFRMMGRANTRLELVATPQQFTMVFEEVALGNRREVYMRSQHPAKYEPTWLGDSMGSWDGDTLVVETVGFNDRTWLSDDGAPHGEHLRVVERYRPVEDGKYLEVQVTATDPDVLTAPYTYTRYYARLDTELIERFCNEDP